MSKSKIVLQKNILRIFFFAATSAPRSYLYVSLM